MSSTKLPLSLQKGQSKWTFFLTAQSFSLAVIYIIQEILRRPGYFRILIAIQMAIIIALNVIKLQYHKTSLDIGNTFNFNKINT